MVMDFLGKEFSGFRVRSFYMSGDLVCACLVLFFKTSDSRWFSLTIGEGVALYHSEAVEPKLLDLCDINDEFAYPVREVNLLDRYLGECVFSVFEYRLKCASDICVGVYFNCGNCGFSVLEAESCLFMHDGKSMDLLREAVLVEV